MASRFIDDIRQTGVVMSQELRKYLRGKKLIGFLVLVIAIIAIIYLIYTLTDAEFPSESKDFILIYLQFATILAIVAVTLFSASLLVSEYEERTGLLLFTRPIKKGSIFVGKFLAGFIVSALVMIIYYLAVAIMSYFITGSIYGNLWTSLALMITYLFGTTGIALLFSSLFKKGSTATIMTFVVLLILGTIISQLFAGNGIEPWFSITYSSGSIVSVLNGVSTSVIHTNAISSMWYYVADPTLSAMVMAAWGIFTSLFAAMIFKRRGF